MTVVIGLLYLVFFVLVIPYLKLYHDELITFNRIRLYFILKVVCGFATFLVFEKYFGGGDMVDYFHDSLIVRNAFFENPILFLSDFFQTPHQSNLLELPNWVADLHHSIFNDNRLMLFIVAILRTISFNSLLGTIVLYNMISLIGSLKIYQFFFNDVQVDVSSVLRRMMLLLPFLLPSVLVFTSSLLKDALVIFFLGVFLVQLKTLKSGYTTARLLYFLSSVFLMLFMKSYLLVFLLPASFVYLLHNVKAENSFKRIMIFCSFFAVILIIVGNLFPDLHLPSLLFGQKLSCIRNAVFSGANSLVSGFPFAPSWMSCIMRSPQAFFFGLLSPFPFQTDNVSLLVFSLDGIITFFFFFYSFYVLFINKLHTNSESLFGLIFGCLFLLVLGFTIPVLGNLVRLKVVGILLLLISSVKIGINRE
jgi:hypothetical protein